MGQKINPVSLRLQYTNRKFDNCWYSNYFYKNLIIKDIYLQKYLNNFLKLLKFPTGRYSIHHLQKKTQIYNFLCSSQSTREWRSRLFGLNKKNSLKKTRYFFKNKIELKRTRKITKLSDFYTSLNQISIHKIQKKIKSFQNFQLWSKLVNSKTKIVTTFTEKTLYFSPNLPLNLKSFAPFDLSQKSVAPSPQKLSTRELERIDQTIQFRFFQELTFLQNLFVYKNLKSKLNTPIDLKYKNYLEKYLASFYKLELDVIPFKVKNDWQHASYLADEIVYFLEKRIPFRRLKTKLLKELSKISTIRGVRITCSGRVGGKSKKAQRAKVECLKYGQTSLQVFSSKIDFSVKTAFTSFGSVGVKVWICYN